MSPESTSPEPPALMPLSFLRHCLLLLLRERPAHGYDLLERLDPFGWSFSASDPGRLYRMLRTLEAEGLVTSEWEPSQAGPSRRMYQITREGKHELHRGVKALVEMQRRIQVFLSRYEEFVALCCTPAA